LHEKPPALSVNEAAIRHEIFERNALRRRAQLPLLDAQAELEQAVAEARAREYHKLVQPIRAEFEKTLSLRWIARWQRRHQTERWPSGSAISIPMSRHCVRVCERILRMRSGLVRPPFVPRNIAIYGSDKR
jgi:hypothetical protein